MSESKKVSGKEIVKTATESIHDLIGTIANNVLTKQFGDENPKKSEEIFVEKSTEVKADEKQFVTKDDLAEFGKTFGDQIGTALQDMFSKFDKSVKIADDEKGDLKKSKDDEKDDEKGDLKKSKDDEKGDLKKSKDDEKGDLANDITINDLATVIAKGFSEKSGRRSFVISDGNVVNKSVSDVEGAQEIDLDTVDINQYSKINKAAQSQMLKSYFGDFMRG